MFLRRALAPQHREAELEGEQLAPGEPHGAEEVAGNEGNVVRVDEDLQPLHEPARHVEPLGDRLDVPEDIPPIDADSPGHRVERVRLTIREVRYEVKNASELIGGCSHRRDGGTERR
jgi:hypothetical protein